MKAVCQGLRTLPAALAALARSSTLGAADPCHPLHRIDMLSPRAGEPQLEGVKARQRRCTAPCPALLHCAAHGQAIVLRQGGNFYFSFNPITLTSFPRFWFVLKVF